MSAGSNNWVVSAKRTRDGRAILADDMHLPLSVPNTWYRLSLVRPGEGGGGDRITGLTLPGTPAIIAGSNGRVAWGFTNSYGDWSDVVLIDPAPDGADRYLTPDGPRAFERRTERIKVRGAADASLEVSTTIWGPVIGAGEGMARRALRWVAHDPDGANFRLMRMEQARSVDDALDLAPLCGVPAQNLVVADAAGRIGWTILGRIPRRVGFDGAEPVSWADGTRRWEGWLAPSECPRIVDPPGGMLWTANARTVSGASLRLLGDGGYMLGARAAQIRDDLRGLPGATERDMLAVELDDRARFLERWRGLLLDALTPAAVAADPRRGEARKLVEGWGGRASIDSAGYRLVRAFRSELARQVLSAIAAPYRARLPQLDLASEPQSEGPVWRLVTERPAHLLDPRFRGWDEQLLAAVDGVIKELSSRGPRLADRTWGERNLAQIRHPLSRAVPALGRWLDMPAAPLAGDNHMPRVQGPSFGASERMIVSPGHEEDGFLHMPCGQSGHPLSPHYADGQEAWVKGEATPFLPGPPIHTLSLVPAP